MRTAGPLSSQTVQSFLDRVRDVPAGERPAPGGTVEETAEGWRASGLRPGDLVLLALPNGLSLLTQFFGVIAAGGVPALVPPGAPTGRLQELVSTMRARALGAVRLPNGVADGAGPRALGGLQVAMFPAGAAPACSPGEIVLLTSGTSGFSSGCVFSLDALLLNAERHADSIGQRTEDIVLVNLPLHFSFALVAQALATLVRGGGLAISGPPFHALSYFRQVSEHGVTISSLTPVLVRSLLQSRQPFPATLRTLTVGGDALPV
jgi:acyl-CoA synthetase (AMP-forming)/AMP-acid ligase II